MFDAEIFSIGTEILMGRIMDTNSPWLASNILGIGGEIRRITILPDAIEEVSSAIREAIRRGPMFLITTGGLGPTPDDITVDAICSALRIGKSLHEPTLETFMERRGIGRDQVTQSMLKMATVPEGAEVLLNPVGWAPCIKIRAGKTTIFSMPGPPREMKAIFREHIMPFLLSLNMGKRMVRRAFVHMFESEISPIMEEIMSSFPGTYLKAYVSLRGSHDEPLPVDIVVSGDDEEETRRKMEEVIEKLKEMVQGKGKRIEVEHG
jgi:molybdenum cofactor synthesis domain-containing protein